MSKISQYNMETGTQIDDTIHWHEFQDRGTLHTQGFTNKRKTLRES